MRYSSLILKVLFVVSISVIFYISAITYKQINSLYNNSELVNHTFNVRLQLNELYVQLKDLETSKRDYILTEDQTIKFATKILMKNIKTSLKEVKMITIDNQKQQNNFKKLEKLVDKKFDIVNEALDKDYTRNTSFDLLSNNLMSGKNVMSELKTQIDHMIDVEEELLSIRTDRYDQVKKNTPLYIYLTLLLTLSLLTFAFFRINKNLNDINQKNSELLIKDESSKLAEEIGKFGVWRWDIDEDNYYYSYNIYRLLGHSPGAMPSTLEAFMSHIHPDDLEYVNSIVQKMIIDKSFHPFRYRIIRADNKEVRHLFANNKLIVDKTGKQFLVGTTTDITDQVQSNISLQERNKELEAINNEIILANNALKFGEEIGKFGNWQWNVDTNKWMFSDNLYKILGAKPHEFEANLENFMKFIHPDDIADVKQRAQQMAEDHQLPPFTYRIIKPTGEITYLKSLGRLFVDNLGNKIRAGCTMDITEDVKNNINLEERNRILEANNKELQAFNYVASHDLQEPLRKIQTFISRLVDKDLDHLSDAGKEYLTRIQAASKRMRTLIDDLLQFSRTTRAEKVFEKVNLNDLLDNSKLELAQVIEESKAIITNNELPTLNVIPFQIQQLFNNLINNSIKYCKESIVPEITINYQKVNTKTNSVPHNIPNNSYHIITFNDNGIGFEQQYADKIFELFSRLHNKNEYTGTGIGLAICKKIVENHKGFIFAQGEPDNGSTFTIYIPDRI